MNQGLPLGFIAAAIYGFVFLMCSLAAVSSFRSKQPPAHLVRWSLLLALFAILIASRLLGIEEGLRDNWRSALRVGELYEMRREFQRPAMAIALVVGALAAFGMTVQIARHSGSKRNLYVRIASLSGLTMLTLVVFRLISLSPVDKLLYGPARLNWLIDIGCSFVVALAALAYIRAVKGARR